jgi:hypothetical protein
MKLIMKGITIISLALAMSFLFTDQGRLLHEKLNVPASKAYLD